MTTTIKIVEDFHPLPAGRYVADGKGNGTTFRDDYLVPALEKGENLIIDLDGAPGYPSSFLEEAFGGLIRKNVQPELIRKLIEFKASDPGFQRYVSKIWAHIDRAITVNSAA